MRRTLLLALALTIVLTAPAHAAHRQVPRGWLGVVADGPLTDPSFAQAPSEWNTLAGSGAESVRTAFWWRDIQPNGAGDANWAATDPVVLAAAQRGLGVLPVVQGTPGWARANPADPASPPRDNADFARFMTLLVTRYGPNGSFWSEHPDVPRQAIRDWQIWNEPNITRYWNVAPWAPPYVALLKAAHAALKAADPGSTTVLAGLPNESWTALASIYAAGAKGNFDVVALHPYTGKPENVPRLVKLARGVMAKRGDSRLPIWITELSWPAALHKTNVTIVGFETTDKGQATKLRRGIELLARDRRRMNIGRVYWYTWLSAEGSSLSSFDYSGLRRLHSGVLRSAPALATFRAVARKLEGCAKRAGDASRCR